MDMKQILIAFGIVIGTFVLIIGVVVGIYFYYPELLGFEAPAVTQGKLDNKKKETNNLDSNNKNLNQKYNIKVPFDSLMTKTNSLQDSLLSREELVKIYNDSIAGLVKRIIQLNANENKMTDSIDNVKRLMNTALNDLKEYKKNEKQRDSIALLRKDTLSIKNLETFAKIYNNTSPNEVAKILENLSDRKDVARIIKLMQPKKAGKVLEAMKPEIAADVLLQGSFK